MNNYFLRQAHQVEWKEIEQWSVYKYISPSNRFNRINLISMHAFNHQRTPRSFLSCRWLLPSPPLCIKRVESKLACKITRCTHSFVNMRRHSGVGLEDVTSTYRKLPATTHGSKLANPFSFITKFHCKSYEDTEIRF